MMEGLSDRADRPTLLGATRFWLKLGCISFGGPAGQIATMHEELVDRRAWIDERSFLNGLNYCMMLPGPEAQQLATYIGWRLHGIPGGLIAGGLFILPSFVLLLGLSWVYAMHGHTLAVEGVLRGIKPVVTAVVVQAVWRIGGRAFGTPLQARLVAIGVAAFLAILLLNVPFPLVVLGAALIGLLDRESSMTPKADRPSLSVVRLASCAGVGTLAWGIPMVMLKGELSRLAWFFSKAALVGFGGAYALLPYINQAAVQFGWLTPSQIDRKSTRLNSSHIPLSRMPSSA